MLFHSVNHRQPPCLCVGDWLPSPKLVPTTWSAKPLLSETHPFPGVRPWGSCLLPAVQVAKGPGYLSKPSLVEAPPPTPSEFSSTATDCKQVGIALPYHCAVCFGGRVGGEGGVGVSKELSRSLI